jgi:hypothetical protein
MLFWKGMAESAFHDVMGVVTHVKGVALLKCGFLALSLLKAMYTWLFPCGCGQSLHVHDVGVVLIMWM